MHWDGSAVDLSSIGSKPGEGDTTQPHVKEEIAVLCGLLSA